MDELFESLRISDSAKIAEVSNRAEEQKLSAEETMESAVIGEVTAIEAQQREVRIGHMSLNRLYWDIPAAQISRLEINGRPIVANRIAFTISNLGWRAGGGWPWYTVPCPHGGRAGGGFWMPGALRHCTALVVGNVGFSNCHMSAQAQGNGSSIVLFGVNDDNYGDNSGGYRLYLDGWS